MLSWPATEVERANLVFQKMMYQQPEAPQKEQPERERQPEKEPGTPKKDSRRTRLARYQHQLSYARRERGEDDE